MAPKKDTQIIPRGQTFVGTVIRAKAHKTVKVEFERRKFVPKYERYLKARTRLTAHNPAEINAKEGDLVQVQECRPLSKTKSFVITKIMGHKDAMPDMDTMVKKKKTAKKEETPKEQ